MIRVEAPSRLHFGLLSLPAEGRERWPNHAGAPGLPVRQFGGVGLMVEAPGVAVSVSPAAEWSAEGPLAERALAFARAFAVTLPPDERRPFHIRVEHCPPEHAGLGVGTQLGLAVGRALAAASGHPEWDAPELARRVGRGERSAVGVHGFDRGGLIVEPGKLPGEALSPLVARYDFPEDWRVLLARPAVGPEWFGARERQAFGRLRAGGEDSLAGTEALCRLVLLGLLPALVGRDLPAFGETLFELNARVGLAFAAVQGGTYAGPAVAELVGFLRSEGVRGVGQSSWGQTVFAVIEDELQGAELADRLERRFRLGGEVVVTKARNRGAVAGAGG